jgi:hypothetical protein
MYKAELTLSFSFPFPLNFVSVTAQLREATQKETFSQPTRGLRGGTRRNCYDKLRRKGKRESESELSA